MIANSSTISLTLATGALIFLGSSKIAGAVGIVDQSFDSPPFSAYAATSLTGDTLYAQSFTVGLGGLLTGADLLAFDGTSGFGTGAPPVSDMIVQIRSFMAGLPTGTVLASFTVPASNLLAHPNGQFTHVDFSTGVPVEPGQVLALGITGAGVGWYMQTGANATYPGGQAFVRLHDGFPWTPFTNPSNETGDFFFRTYVTVPEPSTASIIGFGVAMLLIFAARFRHGHRTITG